MRANRRSWWVRLAACGAVIAAMGTATAKDAPKVSKALLVLDLQDAFLEQYPDADAFLARVNGVIERTRGKVLTIYVTQGGGGEITGRVRVVSRKSFMKTSKDAFSNAKLAKLLERSGIRDVYLVGIDAWNCVYATAQGALRSGYRVHAVRDAVLTRFADQQEALDRLADLGLGIVDGEDL